MPSSFPNSAHFRPSLLVSQPFFSITAILQILTWSVTFILQSFAEAHHHPVRGSDGGNAKGTPIGIGWFAIFFQLLIIYRVLSSVGRETEQEDRGPIAVLVAINVVSGVLCTNSNIYNQLDLVLRLYGYGWMILSGLNLAWLLYFTSSDQSKLLSFLNPAFQRKQLIRSSINLRRSGSHSNINFPVITSEYPGHYAGSHDISLEPGHAVDLHQSLHNEKLMNEVTTALLPSHHAYVPEGPDEPDTFRVLDSRHGHQLNNCLPTSQPLPDQYHADRMLPLQQNHLPKALDDSHGEPKQAIQQTQPPHQQGYHLPPSQPPRSNFYPIRLDPSPNNHQPNFPQHPLGISKGQASTSDLTGSLPLAATLEPQSMPPIDRSILNQAYREEEFRSTSHSDSPSTVSHAPSRGVRPVKKARAIYAYNASPADPNEVSFEKGEILEITNHNGKWWQARRTTGQSGIVPSNYLQMLPDP